MKVSKYLFVLLVLLCIINTKGVSQGSLEQDSLILIELYEKLDGPNWQPSWQIQDPISTWNGVNLNENNRVKAIQLSGVGMEGELPAVIGNLDGLEQLNLSENKLTGNLPSEVASLEALKNLDLSENFFSGSIPEEWRSLTGIGSLKLSQNFLSDTIPDIFKDWEFLNTIWVNDNLLVGEIPNSWKDLNTLISIRIEQNSFNSIPDFSQTLDSTKIEEFSVNDNFFDFENLEKNIQFITQYSPQKTNNDSIIGINITEGNDLDLDVSFIKGDNNQYSWVFNKDGASSPLNEQGDKLKLGNIDLENTGVYRCTITNSLLPELKSIEITFDVNVSIDDITVSESDSLALVELYNSTKGDLWTNQWDLESRVTTWYGITLRRGRVYEVILNSNNLEGEFPVSVVNLIELRILNLSSNNLTGDIPTTINQLINVQILNLSLNLFTGEIGNKYDDFRGLKELYLFSNDLEGEISLDFNAFEALEKIDLSNNEFVGSIPDGFGTLLNLEELSLQSNNLSGNIPESIGDLTKLRILDLDNNLLTGNLPLSFTNLVKLEELYLHNNRLSGELPISYRILPLKILHLHNNNFSGSLPTRWSELTQLEELFIYNNEITGSLPIKWGELSKLTSLRLQNNQLSDSIPKKFGDLNQLITLDLYNNQLSGSIPNSLSELRTLQSLNIEKNLLSGEIPSSLGEMSSLVTLDLSDNELSGTIPSGLGRLPNLETLLLNNNLFTNADTLGISNSGLQFLQSFDLSGNELGFDDLAPNLRINESVAFNTTYTPQRYISTTSISLERGQSVTLSKAIPGEQLTFQWMKGTQSLETTDSTLFISNIEVQDAGIYTRTVRSDLVPELTLTDTFIVDVAIDFPQITGVTTPQAWCLGDTVAELSVADQPSFTINWYNNAQEKIGEGSNIRVQLPIGVDTFYVNLSFADVNSVLEPVVVFSRPVISLNGSTLTASDGGDRYQWSLNGVTLDGETSSTLTSQGDGIYQVTIFKDGCSATSDSFPVGQVVLGIVQKLSGTIELFPNPFKDSWKLAWEGFSLQDNFVQLSLHNLSGKLVWQEIISPNSSTFSQEFTMPQLIAGVYLLEIRTTQGYAVRKLLKQ